MGLAWIQTSASLPQPPTSWRCLIHYDLDGDDDDGVDGDDDGDGYADGNDDDDDDLDLSQPPTISYFLIV